MRKHAWLTLRGVDHDLSIRQPVGCSFVRYKVDVAKEEAFAARQSYWRWYERQFVLRDFSVVPGNSAWRRAVTEAQKAYPGTESWLLSCSSSEGGHGRWVRYGGGSYYDGYSGVGGWLQFLPGTFWRMFGSAHDDVTTRGYKVPRSAHSWTSALGQALAGAWGVSHGRSHEWAGAGC